MRFFWSGDVAPARRRGTRPRLLEWVKGHPRLRPTVRHVRARIAPAADRVGWSVGRLRGTVRRLRFDRANKVVLGPGVRISKANGRIALGTDVWIRRSAELLVRSYGGRPAELTIGNHTSIGERTVINVSTRVEIGSGCMIAAGVDIMDTDFHEMYDVDGLVKTAPTSPVRIGDHVWIGAKSTVLKGVTIGDGAIIGAGSVVIAEVAPNTVVAGNPARPVGAIGGWR